MRIVDEILHPKYKITVFKMDTRFSIKFEDRDLEQTYKFREGQIIQNTTDIRQLVDSSFLKKVDQIFRTMRDHHQAALTSAAEQYDEFDDII